MVSISGFESQTSFLNFKTICSNVHKILCVKQLLTTIVKIKTDLTILELIINKTKVLMKNVVAKT